MLPGIRAALLTTSLVVLCAPGAADAQVRRGRAAPTAQGWAPVSVGARFGYDSNARGQVLGAFATIPVVRDGRFAVAPSWDVTFVSSAEEYQYGLDALWISAGREGGLFLGGSVGYRDTVVTITESGERSTLFTYGAVAGFRTGTNNLLQLVFELRWIFLEDTGTNLEYRPIPISLGLAFPLWGRS